MKKIKFTWPLRLAAISVGLLLCIAGVAMFSDKETGAFFVGQKECLVNGETRTMEDEPFLDESGKIVVPLRFLAYALGVPEDGIKWNEEAQTVTLVKDGTTVLLRVGDTALYINGVLAGQMDTCPILRNGRVFLPAQFVAEAFNHSVSWDEGRQKIAIGVEGSSQGLKLEPTSSGADKAVPETGPPTNIDVRQQDLMRGEDMRQQLEIQRILKQDEQRRFLESQNRMDQIEETERNRKMMEENNLRQQRELQESIKRQQETQKATNTPPYIPPKIEPVKPYVPPVRPYTPPPVVPGVPR